MTSIGFGGGEVIQVELSLDEVARMLEEALKNGELLRIVAQNGETMLINPEQVKVLQNGNGANRTEAEADAAYAGR